VAVWRISATNSRRRNQDVRRDRLRAGEISSDATGLPILLAALAALALPWLVALSALTVHRILLLQAVGFFALAVAVVLRNVHHQLPQAPPPKPRRRPTSRRLRRSPHRHRPDLLATVEHLAPEKVPTSRRRSAGRIWAGAGRSCGGPRVSGLPGVFGRPALLHARPSGAAAGGALLAQRHFCSPQ
jgi:hypothetical protein